LLTRSGDLLPSGGEDPAEDTAAAREISGERLFGSIAGSGFEPGMGIGSDISDNVRLWAVEDEIPKETRRSNLPPPRTKPSAMIAGVEQDKDIVTKLQIGYILRNYSPV
jgi:hypothetical protein